MGSLIDRKLPYVHTIDPSHSYVSVRVQYDKVQHFEPSKESLYFRVTYQRPGTFSNVGFTFCYTLYNYTTDGA